MWAFGRFPSLTGFFEAGKELGFDRFELNHGVDSAMLEGLSLKGMIPSVHEPCPADISMVELKRRNWLISAPDEHGRRQGVLAAQRSIDLAQELGAELVVVHAGRVDVGAEFEDNLWAMFDAGQVASTEYADLKERLVIARREKAEANLAAARRSILELTEYAGRAGVRLGLENRYHYLDIPLLDEMDGLLAAADGGQLGFLYDVGHAQVLENLGLGSHEAWLQRYASRMIGVHLHNVRGLKDHYAAGLGEVDWDMVAAYLPQDALRTLEYRHHNSRKRRSWPPRQFLADKGCVWSVWASGRSRFGMPFLLIVIIAIALVFDFLNGLHDSSNIVATMISSRAMSPRTRWS